MKNYLFYSIILLFCLSFKPSNHLVYDLFFENNSTKISYKNYQILEKVIAFSTSNSDYKINIEVFDIKNNSINRKRVDEILAHLEGESIKVSEVLYYSDLSHLPKAVQGVENLNFVRLSLDTKPIEPVVSVIDKEEKSIKDALPIWAKPVVNYHKNEEQFKVSNFSTIKIETADGSFIKFEPESFVFEDGTFVTSPIIITTKYATTKSLAILDELSTTFNNQPLESQGMIYVNATSEGKQLKIKEGKSFTINVRFDDAQPDFQAFDGNINPQNGQIDWFLAEDDKVELKRTKEDYNYYKYVLISAEERKVLNKKRQAEINQWKRGNISRKIIRKRLRKYRKNIKSRNKRIKEQIEKRGKKETKRPKDGRQPKIYHSHIMGRTAYKCELIEKKFKDNRRNFAKMQSNTLGWKNIDRLLKETIDKPPCDLKVLANKDMNVKVIFNDYFSVFKGVCIDDAYYFPSFPSTMNITIIAAQKLENGKIKYSSYNTTLANKTVQLKDYKTVREQQFISFVKSLDS